MNTGNDGLFAIIDAIPSSARNFAKVAFILISPICVDEYTFAQTGHKMMSSFTEFKRLASHPMASTVARKSLHKRHLHGLIRRSKSLILKSVLDERLGSEQARSPQVVRKTKLRTVRELESVKQRMDQSLSNYRVHPV